MPSPEFARPQEQPQRRRPELHIVPPPEGHEEIEPEQIIEAREMTPLEMAKARVEQLHAELAQAEDQLRIEETREVIGNSGSNAEEEFFKKGDTPGALDEG